MEKTIKIEGMMCPHCEARVKQKLEELDGVLEVIASFEEKKATVKLNKDVSLDILVKTIEDQGYKVIGYPLRNKEDKKDLNKIFSNYIVEGFSIKEK